MLVRAGWERPEREEIKRLLIALRAVVDDGSNIPEKLWPRLSFVACALSPPILKHTKVAEELGRKQKREKEQHRIWKYDELAEAVLKEANTPLHWSEIADRAEKMGHRRSFNATGLYNALLRDKDKYAHIGPGTYGLTAWGLTSVDLYPDIIADILKESEKPLSYGDILQRVSKIRPIKKQSLQMSLDMQPRFYCSLEGSYGLRAWLLPREKQTLRTPKWQVESSDSFERLANAEARGYDISNMLEKDKL